MSVEDRLSSVAGGIRIQTGSDGVLALAGEITWRVTATLRERLFDELEVDGVTGLRLDVREVSSIDRNGVALLVGLNHRAAVAGRGLILIDRNGPVTKALAAMHLLRNFVVTDVVTAA